MQVTKQDIQKYISQVNAGSFERLVKFTAYNHFGEEETLTGIIGLNIHNHSCIYVQKGNEEPDWYSIDYVEKGEIIGDVYTTPELLK